MTDHSTPENLTARELRAWRSRQGLTAQQLADRIAELGGKLTRQAISKIENGDRGVSIGELILLGRALQVPPMLFFLPVGRESEIEVLPGQTVDTYAAAKWFFGMGAFPGVEEFESDGLATWRKGAAPIDLYLSHDGWTAQWLDNRHRERSEKAVLAKAQIHLTRRTMRQLGLRVPPLPDGLTDDFGEAGLNVLPRQQEFTPTDDTEG